MTVITTRLTVFPDGSVSTATQLPTGEHVAAVTLRDTERPLGKAFSMLDFPTHDESWDSGGPLRRTELYDEEGRLS